MQQIDDLIKWAKEEQAIFMESKSIVYRGIGVWIKRHLLPKLEGCKTSPNRQSAPLKHEHTYNDDSGVCIECGALPK